MEIKTTNKNRWLIALSAVGVHISIGSVYAWSVFNKPLENAFGWTKNEIAITFSLAIVFLGLSAAVLGRKVERIGPKKSSLLAGIFWGLGLLGTGISVSMGNLYLLWLCYGVVGGIGLGIGYIAPVSTLVQWFPDRRGLATGLAIMGFGFGALIGAPIFNMLIDTIEISNTFFVIGAAYLLIMLLSALYLERPPENWVPAGMKEGNEKQSQNTDISQLMAKEAVRTLPFYGLWIMLFINTTCGIALIYTASPLAQESIGLSAVEAAAVVGLMSLFNGIGRLAWSSASDYLGRPSTYLAFFIIQIAAFILILNTSNVIVFQVLLFLIITCYGGAFATMPAFIGDLFGTKQLGAILGYILTAWSAAGIVGPQLIAYVRSTTGSYESSMYIFACIFIIALVVSVFMLRYVKKAYKIQAG